MLRPIGAISCKFGMLKFGSTLLCQQHLNQPIQMTLRLAPIARVGIN
jgi:hypothetical protein